MEMDFWEYILNQISRLFEHIRKPNFYEFRKYVEDRKEKNNLNKIK